MITNHHHTVCLTQPPPANRTSTSLLLKARAWRVLLRFQQLTYQMETAEKTMLNIAVMLKMLR